MPSSSLHMVSFFLSKSSYAGLPFRLRGKAILLAHLLTGAVFFQALAQSPDYPTAFPIDNDTEAPPYIPENTKAIYTESYVLVDGDTLKDEEGGDLFWKFRQ